MIVLSWIKRLFERFQRLDDEEQISHMNHSNEKINSDGENHSSNRPTFRFPIITDAEIYGWDEELPDKQIISKSTSSPTLEEEDFEPIPLYMNERWPREKITGTIYRASDRKLDNFRTEQSDQRIELERKSVIQQERRESIIAKRSTRPFSPTQVPSPVFGFEPPPIKKEQPEIEDEKLPTEIDSRKTDVERILQNDEDIVNTEREYVEQTQLVNNIPEEDFESLQEELPNFTEQIKEDDIISKEAFQQECIHDQTIIENEQEMFSEDINQKNTSFIEEAPVEVEQIEPPVEKERIVPFNVLMLKSDKEKIIQPQRNIQVNSKSAHPIPNKGLTSNGTEREDVSSDEKMNDESLPHYVFPSLDELIPPEQKTEDTEWLHAQSEKLEEALSHFSIQANVIDAVQGPTVTRFELTVGHGTKVSKIRNLTDDLKLALAAEEIRIQAPIPGRSSIGVEIPNRVTRPVRISEVIRTEQFQQSTSPMEAVLGLDLTGTPQTIDLRKMPHGMIAGATGSGKSVCINSILVSLLYKANPTELKMMLIDPKMVELAPFNGIPHLISPVITDVKAANAALKWAVEEMERRYELLAHTGVRDIERYNQFMMKEQRYSLKMPYLLIVIDELADLMMMAPADVEVSISRIAQKARACGIHLIIATQRPSVDVITGIIKANIPTRIAFSVSSQIDSRTILDTPGAERLLGRGDMLYIGNGQSSPSRLQGTFVTDEEMERIIEHVKQEASPVYLFGQDDLLASAIEEEETDPLFDEVCKFIVEQGSASTSLLQRHFSIGYNRAAKLIDRMEEKGFISGQRGSKPRDVYLTESDLETLSNRKD